MTQPPDQKQPATQSAHLVKATKPEPRPSLVSGAILGVAAFVCGLGIKAYAEAPAGLRGFTGSASTSVPNMAANITPSPVPGQGRVPASAAPAALQSFLANGIWRAGACTARENFQTFRFGPTSSVEVGSGVPGEGEKLELLGVREVNGLVAVETRVCAPVGCNQTFEQYKRLDANRIQEWHFEGRLPNEAPYVLVSNGRATDGSQGRVFQRCAS
jgi:hypothetical protein